MRDAGFVTTSSSPSVDRRAPGPLFAALTGITSLLIFVQAITAGEFVSQKNRDGWIAVHGIVGDVTLLAALGTAIYALVALRR
ncbi:MAG: hypothetical protein QOC59_1191, partial [Microbacteriaceae bacterium]|nr:hypothetical protein [Microbacteriaceae bacterium]